MLTNLRDAFRGQSRSPNAYVRYSFLFAIVTLSLRRAVCRYATLSIKRTVFEIIDFKNAVTLKTGLGVLQRHWKYHDAIERIRLPIDVL